MSTATGATIESKKDFKETPQGKYNYWSEELQAAQLTLRTFHKQGDKINARYLGKNKTREEGFKLNLFHSNVTTLGDMLYGNTPKIDVSRRYAQADDDVGRVAAEMIERLLNLDIAANGAEIDAVLRSTLQDRLLPGLGCARVRYEMESEQVDTPDGPQEQLISEAAPVEYYFWGDVLWGWARNWADVPWLAYRSYLTKDEIEERFGEDAADNIPLKKQKAAVEDENSRDSDEDGAWMKGEIWEIWCKETRIVHWIAFGYDKQLEEKEDPLQLQDFFPSPPFLLANPTTTLYLPTADFTLAQDLYNEVDKLQTRISIITEAVKVVGVYDASADGVQRMFQEGMDNDLIPIDKWALFAEKGGIAGQLDWLPLQDIVNALDKLVQLRDDTIGLLQQITGMSDVMQGGLKNQYEGVGQSEMKAKFGSIRIQALQDQFARFASDLMQIKAEVIARHISPQTIAQQANMEFSVDRELVPQAVELIKNPGKARLRVAIRPESVAMVDYAQLKNERTDYINALATFMQSAGPMIENDPSSKPFLLQLLQWGVAGFKGASEIEGVVDKAIEASQQAEKEAQANPQADPEQAAQQAASQLDQMKQQGEMQKIQAKAQADAQTREHDMQADIQTAMATHQAKLAEIEAELQSTLAETQAKLQADVLVEQVQAQSNMAQTNATVEGEVRKDVVEAKLDIAKEQNKTANKINEIAISAAAKIKEAKAKPTPTPTPTPTGAKGE